MMRTFGIVLALCCLAGVSCPAWALTHEEVLQRRLDRMRQADAKLQEEERNQQDRASQLPKSITDPQKAKSAEPLVIPDPPTPAKQSETVPPPGMPFPEPHKSVWDANAVPPAVSKSPVTSRTGSAAPAQAAPAPADTKTDKRDPKTAAALAAKAAKKAKAGDVKTALALIDRAIAADPTDPDLHNNRGNILANSGQPRQALAEYDRAITMGGKSQVNTEGSGLFGHDKIGDAAGQEQVAGQSARYGKQRPLLGRTMLARTCSCSFFDWR